MTNETVEARKLTLREYFVTVYLQELDMSAIDLQPYYVVKAADELVRLLDMTPEQFAKEGEKYDV